MISRQILMNAISRLSTEELKSFLLTVPDNQLPTEYIKAREQEIPTEQKSSQEDDFSYLGNSVANTTTEGGPTFDWMSAMNEPLERSQESDYAWMGSEKNSEGASSFEIKENLNKKGEGQLKLKTPKIVEEKDKSPTIFSDNSDVPYSMNDSNNV